MEHKTEQKTDATLSMVITRADGRIENLGQISATYSNPLKQICWRLVGLPLANRRIRRANRNARSS